ncbi:MAG: hypothetical protein PWR01_2173 [Clostridiales bacterium]|jgi:hypothetical protein|nr:hypothetical protein [Clostridiales bacterium]MDN5281100.1 hypothetical protein [Candidatus Ozemobacter sp.]
MRNLTKNRKGAGYLIVIGFTLLLVILFAILGRVKTGQSQLQSKEVRRYLATSLGEAALNCIIAEINANRGFSTHRYYSEKNEDYWVTPYKSRDSVIGKMGDIYVSGVANGIYTGGCEYGEFKCKVAPMYSTRENSKTKTLRESEMYTRAEILVKVGSGWGINENTCRKITALIERRYPATESLLYDGEFLDLGALGPFENRENKLRRGRLYGYHWITFNTAGGSCKGSELYDMEKIETPGLMRALKDTRIGFADGSKMVISSQNDSVHINKFETHDGFLLDGAHGAHPIKFNRLPRERLKYWADRYRKSQGITITEGMLEYGDFRNPYDPGTRFVDIDFKSYRCNQDTKPTSSEEDDEGDEEGENSGENSNLSTSDDPEYCRERNGKKLLIYSEVPLRIWGCPDRTITIYSTRDIVIGGDFNQNPWTPQLYKDNNYTDYKFDVSNGKEKHKVGALIMSEGRILIDHSHPTLFARNEIKPYFLYCLAYALHPSTPEIEAEIKDFVCPIDPRQRKSLVGLGEFGADGEFVARYGTIKWLHANQNVNSGGSYNANMEDVINFFTPGMGNKPRFGIKDEKVRTEIIEYLKTAVRDVGDLTVSEQDKIFDMAWTQAMEEEAKAPLPTAGAMGIMQHLFNEAVKNPDDGIYVPEITINANLVSSAWRSAKWRIGNSPEKVEDEIGNAGFLEYLKKPAFLIQRVYGGVVRLGTKKPDYYMSGAHTGSNILRRRIWDNTNLANRKFKALEVPAVHNLLTFTDEFISLKEYNKFQ